MDRLDAMSLLVDTLEAGSFSAAARRRGVPVATLTRKIDHLERHLGTVLLLRSTRRLTLTDAGQHYVAGARAVLAQVQEIEREAAGEFAEPVGRLAVSAPRMFGRLHVLPIVGDFLRRHPGITIDLRLADGNVDLAAGAADLAVRIGALPDSSLVATRVGSLRLVTAASPGLLARFPVPEGGGDPADWPTVALDRPSPPGTLGPHGEATPPAGRVRLVVSSAEAAVDAAVAGIGAVRLLSYQVADAVAAGRLVLVREAPEGAPAPVHLVHAPLPQLPQKTRRFLDAASDGLREALRRLAGG